MRCQPFAPFFMFFMVFGGCTPPEIAPDAVGSRESTLQTAYGDDMPIRVWYPGVLSDDADAVQYALGGEGLAYEELEVATGPWPVVLWSHGNGGSRDAGAAISEQLAAEIGAIVIAPDHVGNTFEDPLTAESFVEAFVRRPDDLGRAYAWLAEQAEDPDSPFYERLSGELVVGGHSTGGSTALLAAGAGLDKTTIVLACATGQVDGLACELADEAEGQLIYLDFEPIPPPSALLLYAPLSATLLEGDALDTVDAPALVLVGARDDITPVDSDADPVFRSAPRPSALGVFDDAGHYGFATLCDIEGLDVLLDDAHQECTDPSYIEPDVLIDATVALSTAWIATQVKGEPRSLGDIASGVEGLAIEER